METWALSLPPPRMRRGATAAAPAVAALRVARAALALPRLDPGAGPCGTGHVKSRLTCSLLKGGQKMVALWWLKGRVRGGPCSPGRPRRRGSTRGERVKPAIEHPHQFTFGDATMRCDPKPMASCKLTTPSRQAHCCVPMQLHGQGRKVWAAEENPPLQGACPGNDHPFLVHRCEQSPNRHD